MLKNIGLLIRTYNAGEDYETLKRVFTKEGIHTFDTLPAAAGGILSPENTFFFTDVRETADEISRAGYGFAVYENENSRKEAFPDALYLVDAFSDLEIFRIDRMLSRFLEKPWEILTTERCRVREMTLDDVDPLYEIYHSSSFMDNGESLYPDPDEEKRYTVDYIKHQYRFFEYGIWIVEDKETGKIIGRAGFANREGYEDPELGYGFAESARHKGIATEVCTAILAYGKKEFGFSKVNAFSLPENTDSIRLLDRLGFACIRDADLSGTKHKMYQKEL
ncbi:MAG: GNAT family N-acetyltransferase [Lachnospiraceae bacterium]|nr:GNAT family N-acetyltransferase [Lachnospiraceae bacterium]